MRRDIDEALQGWPSNAEPGDVIAREIVARDGRKVLQLRIELGILQMEVDTRPDGVRPHGFANYLDYLRSRVRSKGANWKLSTEQGAELDREFSQFNHRRIAWLTLQRYDRALLDADHSLDLIDFIRQHSGNAEAVEAHERVRGLLIFYRTRAAAALALEQNRPDEAIDTVRAGTERLENHQRGWTGEVDRDETPNETLISQLREFEEEIRKNFEVEKTLREQLDEAVANEDYERAAHLRDQIRNRAKN